VLCAALSALPIAAALAEIGSALELGADAPWTFTLMVADGQIGFEMVLAGAFLAGSLIGAAALAFGGGGRLAAPFVRANTPDPDHDDVRDRSDER
jgi:hypothetical protein